METQLIKGQKVWLQSRLGLSEQTITSIGNKWFKLSNDERCRYSINDLKLDTQYHWAGKIWLSYQDYLDTTETNELFTKLRKFFDSYDNTKLTLPQLREINKIINT